jgi:hypothetical protein
LPSGAPRPLRRAPPVRRPTPPAEPGRRRSCVLLDARWGAPL